MKGTSATLLAVCVFAGVAGADLLFGAYLERAAPDDVFAAYASHAQLAERRAARRAATGLIPHRYLGYAPTPNYASDGLTHDADGFRGPAPAPIKAPGEFRIAAIGGSTTYGFGIAADALTYPARLESHLRAGGMERARVLNAGVNGYGSRESVINLALRVRPRTPDLVIFYEGLNDAHTRFVWPADRLKGDDGVCRLALVDGLFAMAWYEHSNIARALAIAAGAILPHSALDRTWAPTGYADGGACHTAEFLRQKRAGTYPQGLFRETPAAAMSAAAGTGHYEANARAIAALARAMGARPVFVTFVYRRDFPDPVVASDEYATAMDEHNDALRKVAREMRVPLFDLAAEGGFAREHFTDGRHMTPAGADRMASILAAWLLRLPDGD